MALRWAVGSLQRFLRIADTDGKSSDAYASELFLASPCAATIETVSNGAFPC